jgi:hypothetical protein
VTVGANKFEVSFVASPILEPFSPGVVLVAVLLARVDVVNVKDTVIGVAAPCAFATELGNKRHLPFPDSALLDRCRVLVPKVPLAIGRTKSRFGWFAAVFAGPILSPSVSLIAFAAAKLALPTFGEKRSNLEILLAMCANECLPSSRSVGWKSRASFVPRMLSLTWDRAESAATSAMKRLAAFFADMVYFSHSAIIWIRCDPAYYAIAERRIRQAEQDATLFEQVPPVPEPAGLFDGETP